MDFLFLFALQQRMYAPDDVTASIFEIDAAYGSRRCEICDRSGTTSRKVGTRRIARTVRSHEDDVPRRRAVGEDLIPLAVPLVDGLGRKLRAARRLKLR